MSRYVPYPVLFAALGLLGVWGWIPGAQAASVQLAWDYLQNPEHPATGFILERCTGAACTNFVPITPSPLPLTPLTFADTTVQPAAAYRWQLRAIDAQGGTSLPSNQVTFQVPLPAMNAPTGLRGSVVP
jgi:hypothetical protein